MSTATRFYSSREALKRATGIAGTRFDTLIDSKLAAATQDVEMLLSTTFIPITATKLFRWPARVSGRQTLLLEDERLLAVTALLTKAQDASPTTIAAADYFLEPNRSGPPYTRIEIDISSSASFESGNTPQRSISVAGRWGYSEDTIAAGALAEADDGTETALDVTDASLVDVGDTMLIGTEALFVSGRSLLTTTTTLNDTLTADDADNTVTVADGTKIKQGEVIHIESEKMLVESIAGNDLTVIRKWDGSLLAAHSTGLTIYAGRTLTVVRGVNGTTAAAHDTATAIRKYVPPADIVELCQAEAMAHLRQDQSGWTGQIAGSDGSIQMKMTDLFHLRQRALEKYGLVTL